MLQKDLQLEQSGDQMTTSVAEYKHICGGRK